MSKAEDALQKALIEMGRMCVAAEEERDAARALCAEAAEAIRERCICDECGYHDAPVCDGCILAARLEAVSK